MKSNPVSRFFEKHREIWKFIKFSIAGSLSSIIEIAIYYVLQGVVFASMNTQEFHIWIFSYEGIGYFWSFLISTTIGYAIAFILNRKITFHADANPALSVFLYILMVLFTICVTTLLGTGLLDWFISIDMRTLGEVVAKPIVTTLAFVWTYPFSRFVVHRKKKQDP